MIESVFQWVGGHGYFVIFGLFALGIIGLPVPNELLLAYLGFLIYKGSLHLVPTVGAALLGSVSGMIVNYAIGRTAGFYLVRKFGTRIHVSEEKIQKMHDWFERKGKWALLFGYFLPGIRHLTAFAAGTSKINLAEFSFFTATGAFIWSSLFIALGFFLEDQWSRETTRIHRILAIGSALVVVLAAAYLALQKRRGKKP